MKVVIAFSPATLLLDVGIPTIVFGGTEIFQFEDKQYDDCSAGSTSTRRMTGWRSCTVSRRCPPCRWA